jgi:hypothetical protein
MQMNADAGANHEDTCQQPDSVATADELASDISLMLMYLSSWKERPDEALRFWKGFSFDILNQLAEQGLIHDSRRAKSAYLTDAGVRRARELLTRYRAADPWEGGSH